jgi:uncharacterized protein
MHWKVSRYTHAIDLDDGKGLLHNGRTGSIVELSPRVYGKVRELFDSGQSIEEPNRGSRLRQLFSHLIAGGFVVRQPIDELGLLEDTYETERKRSQFLLTILPTFGCNLGCDYCFVGKKKGMMSLETQNHIVQFVSSHIANHSIPSMNVDWFGGEPLLSMSVIQYLSAEFIRICGSHGIPYHSQVITNGTVITPNVVAALQEAQVQRLQITIDGPPDLHDIRRPYKAGHSSSFSAIMSGLPLVIGKFLIRLRINVDNRNLHAVWPLIDLFAEKGWLGPDTEFFPYLARISPFTEACSTMSNFVCSMDDFYRVQFRWMERLEKAGVPVSAQGLYQFPEPKTYNCGAVGANGFVFTPEGEIHKCGLAVDNSPEAIGHVSRPLDSTHPNAVKWQQYSPFQNPVCRNCEFLPTCLGGCPRNQIEMREVQKKENCTYHKQFEHQILLFHLGHRSRIVRDSGQDVPVGIPASSALLPILP